MDIRIREWKIEDKTDLAENLNNMNILNNLRDGLPYPYTEDDAEDFIQVIGSIGVFRQENIHYRTAEMGYYIGEKYWGKGYMTEAVELACDFVFSNTDIIRIFAEPFAYNTASCRVLEKAGFAFEGILKSNAVKNGSIVDMKMYARVKE